MVFPRMRVCREAPFLLCYSDSSLQLCTKKNAKCQANQDFEEENIMMKFRHSTTKSGKRVKTTKVEKVDKPTRISL